VILGDSWSFPYLSLPPENLLQNGIQHFSTITSLRFKDKTRVGENLSFSKKALAVKGLTTRSSLTNFPLKIYFCNIISFDNRPVKQNILNV